MPSDAVLKMRCSERLWTRITGQFSILVPTAERWSWHRGSTGSGVDELDGHMTPSLRRWVAGRRDETCRRILLDTPECFVEHATNEHIRRLCDLTFKMRVEEYERPATQKPTG